jgi:hypothetical protein
MQIRLKMSWGQWSKGRIFDMPGGQARTLIARGIAEEVVQDSPNASDKSMASPVDRAMRSNRNQYRAKGAAA